MHALEVEHVLDVHVEDPRVGVRRAQHCGVQRVRAGGDVVDVPPVPAQEPLVLDPLDPGPEQLGRHAPNPVDALSSVRSSNSSCPSFSPLVEEGAPVPVSRPAAPISAARSTDLTMFW